jgi:hypothetical protein
MSVASHDILPAKAAHKKSGLPWYIRDLYIYLLTLGCAVIKANSAF